MSAAKKKPGGPDFTKGVATSWQRNGNAYVGKKVKRPGPPSPPAKGMGPRSVVILGGGAAGNAAAAMLRREAGQR